MGSVSLSATFANSGAVKSAIAGVLHNPIPLGELTAIRSTAAAILDLDCIISRKTVTQDSTLHLTETWAVINDVLAGMAQPTAGQLANYDYLIGSLASWQIRLPFGTDVQAQDHLLIAGQTLIVQVLLNPRSFAGTVLLLASEVKG
jgi:hypothetical protein